MRLWPFGKRSTPAVHAQTFNGLKDPAFLEFIRNGGEVSAKDAMKNSAVMRCVNLISGAIGQLPLRIIREKADGTRAEDRGHDLWRLLMHRPNSWQSAFEFKRDMQHQLLVNGNAYALILRTGPVVRELIPLDPARVAVEQKPDWRIEYRIERQDGSATVQQEDILHLRGPSDDFLNGISRVKKAADVIGTALKAQMAADRLFDNGMMASGYLKHPNAIGPEAVQTLRQTMDEYFSGARNAGRWMILEEGMEAHQFAATAESSQLDETRAAQVEEIARIFDVPRPLLFMDDTSWGSGIEQLAILFVRFTLGPWFAVWEEAIKRALIAEGDWETVKADFDERRLLRGTLKDQSEFFARSLGAGGQAAFMTQNEVRHDLGLSPLPNGDELLKGTQNEPAKPA